jgi:RND superfamily putative drug exporter
MHTLSLSEGERQATRAGIPRKDMLLVVVEHPSLAFDSTQVQTILEQLSVRLSQVLDLESGQRLFSKIETAGRTIKGDEHFRADGATLLLAYSALPITQSENALRGVATHLNAIDAEHDQVTLHYLSDGTLKAEIFDLIHQDLDRSLLVTLPITLFVLRWAFGAWAGAFLVILGAIISLVGALGAAAIVSHLGSPVSATASQLVVLLVLAVGVDYGLFLFLRIREEARRGLDIERAISRALSSTGRAVFWSGLTVAVSVMGLLLMGDSVLASMAHVSLLAVFITMLGSLWALPAAIKLFPQVLRSASTRPTASGTPVVLAYTLNHPKSAFLISLLVLMCIGSAAYFLRLGTTIEPKLMPVSMQLHKAQAKLAHYFPNFDGVDFSVLISSPQGGLEEIDEAIDDFVTELLENTAIKGPVSVEIAEPNSIRRLQFIVRGSANDTQNQKIVHWVQEDLLPKLEQRGSFKTELTGTLPYVVGEIERHQMRLPLVVVAVLVLSMLFLLVAFRSVVVPVKAVLLNILSCTAAFGILVWVFESQLVPGWDLGVVECFVPALLFCILFGLSMDYHVLVLSRIYEGTQRGMPIREAVEHGVAHTWKPITSAALIMVSVFAVIACVQLPIMRQLGFGLTVAVILDATVVRSVLLPASMLLLGKWNWYLPKALERLPQLKTFSED